MTQMVHTAWTTAAFASKDIVDGMNDLVSEKKKKAILDIAILILQYLFLSAECICQLLPTRWEIEKICFGIIWLFILFLGFTML